MLNTQNPRRLAIVELIYNKRSITLLEIDTSDGAAKLSTLLIKTEKEMWVEKKIDGIKSGVMKKSLGWPIALIKKSLTKEEYSLIRHPTSKHPGLIHPDEIAHWAQRFVKSMQ